jgi:hypothetical protein
MKLEDIGERFEQLAEEILDAVLRLSEAEIDGIYGAARPKEDPKERLFDLTRLATAECADRPQPIQLQAAKAAVAQIPLPLQEPASQTPARVLLVDHDASRLLERRKLFLEKQIAADVTATIQGAIAQLECTAFRLVIVDYSAATDQERESLAELQRFNLEVPIINVRAWENLLTGDGRRLNRDLLRTAARLLRMPIPKRLPERRPPRSAQVSPEAQTLFGTG